MLEEIKKTEVAFGSMHWSIALPKLMDSILSNLYSLNGCGLYNGKAGVSLALYEASRYLQSESVEEKAFRLLQESLLSKNRNVDFEDGLSGVGYVLCFLLQRKLFEADFDDVFGEQYEHIIKSFDPIEKEPNRLITSSGVIYFLSVVDKMKPEDERPRKIIIKIIEGLELFLSLQFHDFTDIHYAYPKDVVLKTFETYLRLISYSGYMQFSDSLIEKYLALYRRDRIMSSLMTGVYLNKILKQRKTIVPIDVIRDNIKNGILNINPGDLSLKERIDIAKIIDTNEYEDLLPAGFLLRLKDALYVNNKISGLLSAIDKTWCPIGYGGGLGRLLFATCTDWETDLL